MEIHEVSPGEYGNVIPQPYHIFGSAPFNKVNINGNKEVFYLLFREGKFRLGLIGGLKDGVFCSPVSAPFGGLIPVSGNLRIEYIEAAVNILKEWAAKKKISSINITIPPVIYDETFISQQISSLWRSGFQISKIDLNHSIDLALMDENYINNIWHNARKNLRIGIDSELDFNICTCCEEKEQAFEIIRKNRECHNYPLRMTWQQIFNNIPLIPIDFFMVHNKNNVPITSAIVYHTHKNVVQVIYWGDLPGYSELKPVNYIAYRLFQYYRSEGKKIVDIGPSTENSLPNYGLCAFKESLGCDVNTKFFFIYTFK